MPKKLPAKTEHQSHDGGKPRPMRADGQRKMNSLLKAAMEVFAKSGVDAPVRSLRGFQRIQLRARESRKVNFTVSAEDLPKATVDVSVGGGQPVGTTPHVKGSL